MNSYPTEAQRVCAVVITYNPDPEFVANVSAVKAQVGQVVVVDNGSRSETEHFLQQIESWPGCTVIRNHQNLGIAAALNIGIRHALQAGFDWVATFDQDSRVSDGFIVEMLETYRQFQNPQSVAIVSPSYVDRQSGVRVAIRPDRKGGILSTMTSGSMMPSGAIRSLGEFDESLFIDQVDTEFCLRARRKGMVVLLSPAVLFHSLGRMSHHKIFGHGFAVTNHSAARRYYYVRNTLRLLVRYWTDWQWVCSETYYLATGIVAIGLVEDHRLQKYQAVLRGVVDALMGKTGKQIHL